MNPLRIELTDDQASSLRGLLDIAVKTGGLLVAARTAEIDGLVLAADAARNVKPSRRAKPPA